MLYKIYNLFYFMVLGTAVPRIKRHNIDRFIQHFVLLLQMRPRSYMSQWVQNVFYNPPLKKLLTKIWKTRINLIIVYSQMNK